MNYVPHPGVFVTAACFGDRLYNDSSAENCLSNLLTSQIRRYVIDIYWDSLNSVFRLCPVQIPTSENASQVATSQGSITTGETIQTAGLFPRQVRSSYYTNITRTEPTPTASSAPGTYSVVSTDGSSELLQLGPYQCSNTLTLTSITSVFNDWLTSTSNTLDAKVIMWILNLHSAAPWQQPTNSSSNHTSSTLPTSGQSISSSIQVFDDVIYKPGDLLSERQNLNKSWFRDQRDDELPITSYFNLITLSNGNLATDDGWPDEDYIQVSQGKRMLIGFGSIDEDMSGYDITMDADTIYPPDYLTSVRDVSFDNNGSLSSGCFYNPDDFTVAQVNNSWAIATINQIGPPNLGDAADNLTTCGISQLLNVTIDGITADNQAIPYQSYGNNAVFGWAYGQPQNDSSIGASEDSKFRCAVMVSNDTYQGHWRVDYCNQQYHVACREGRSPYRWRISDYKVPYESGDAACKGNTTFDVPRTGLENRYLWNAIIADANAKNDPNVLDGIWINFNSLDYQSCWVTTGANGTCPYYEDQSATHSRQILIPTIAALIVLLLTALTILVKCSANARNSRIRRRGEGGWDYEGIPS